MIQEEKSDAAETSAVETNVTQEAVEKSTKKSQHRSNLRGRWKRTHDRGTQNNAPQNMPKEIKTNETKCTCDKSRCEKKQTPMPLIPCSDCLKRDKQPEVGYNKVACKPCSLISKVKRFFCKLFGGKCLEEDKNYQDNHPSKRHFRGNRPYHRPRSKNTHRRPQG
ncbi:MAG: hypothetical protein LBJ78_04350 [Puniceicoccales bacterium]|jgi:hypothetical protein|nr:hypothetical protein [Puniceicoccales bacterium]